MRKKSALDRLTGLERLLGASLSDEIVSSWPEALELVRGLNKGISAADRPWRLPNINELESLVDCSRHSPALPVHHPFTSVQDVY